LKRRIDEPEERINDMPLYEYECTQCKRHTEKIQKFSDPEITNCPYCGGKLERVVSAPAISFKGGGWYADGYGNAKPAAAKSDGNSDGGGSSAASGDSGSSSKETSSAASNDSAAPATSAPAPAAAAPASSDKK
jgi:putative FmdB family regulatory protein